MLALGLRLFKVDGDAFTIVCNENAIFVLDDCNTVRLATLLWVLNYLYRASGSLFVSVGPTRFAQALLVKKPLVSSELAKDQVLICISLILFD